jgi:enolase
LEILDSLGNPTVEVNLMLEDGLAQNDWTGWANMTRTLGKKIEIAGDDLFCTNKESLLKV